MCDTYLRFDWTAKALLKSKKVRKINFSFPLPFT
jgi:hypothetical protein